MWGRKSKKESQGQTCPLCQLVNTEDSESCTRCYYEFTVAAHRQVVSEISDEGAYVPQAINLLSDLNAAKPKA